MVFVMNAKMLNLDTLDKKDLPDLLEKRMRELGLNQAEVSRRARLKSDRIRKALTGTEPKGIDFLKLLLALEFMPYCAFAKINTADYMGSGISGSTWEGIMSKETIAAFIKAENKIETFESKHGKINKSYRTLVIAMISQLYDSLEDKQINDKLIQLAISAVENETKKIAEEV